LESVIGNEKEKHWHRPKKAVSIELYLKSNQTWLVRLVAWRNQLFRIVSGIDLIVKTQNTQGKISNYHFFWSQRIYYITIDVCSYEHDAEKILSLWNIQQMSAI